MLILTDESGRIVGAGHNTAMLAKSFATLKERGETPAKSEASPMLLFRKPKRRQRPPTAASMMAKSRSDGPSDGSFDQLCRELDAVRRRAAIR